MENQGISIATLLRMKAEKIMKSRPAEGASIAAEGDILKLLHELEVYSVELEIQNEELLNVTEDASELANKNKLTENIRQRLIHEFELNQVELEIQSAELTLSNTISNDIAERYSDLFNFSSSCYLILSKEGEILDLNFSGARLLGKERMKLKNSRFGFFVSEYDRPAYNDFLTDLFKHKSRITCEVSLILENSKSINVLLSGVLNLQEDQCLITVLDITERKQFSKYRELTREVLQALIEPGNIKEILHHTLGIIKERTGFDAVGIRLQDGIDFPYSDQTGFSRDFILEENSLIELDKRGKVCRDKNGDVRLVCTCGLVISGKADPSDPNVTPGGSWWTNDSNPFLNIPPHKDARYHPRNSCIRKGYASIALVPIRNNEKIVGLIQFNDYRKDVFSLNKIEFLEGIAAHIGAALMRKQAEETLRKNEELLRTITENAPDIIIQLDQNGIILYMNRPMPGYSMSQSLGMNFCEWTLPEYHAMMNQSLKQVFEESITQTYLSRGYDTNGETRWYRSSISPVNEGGIVEKAILITRDITESIISEEILRESEEKRKTIVMTAMDGFWISDRQGCILEVNDAYSKMIGYSRHELLTMRVQDLELNENAEETKAHIQKIIKLGEERFETRHRCKNGSIIYIDASVQYRKLQGGVFIAFLHNITNRIKREKAMFESNEQFRLLFENSLDAILFTNLDGSVYSVNPEAERMLGMRKEEIIGLEKDGVSDIHDPRLEPALEERRKTGRFKGELNFVRKDGTPFPVDITATIFEDSNGIKRSSIIARDITERKKTEEALRINNVRLNLAMSVANMAWWEMNTTTGSITFENRKAEMLGFQPGEFTHYTDFMKLVHPEDAEHAMEAMRKHIYGQEEKYETEYRILTKSGEYKWFYDIGSVTTRDENGKSIIVTGMVTDITERRIAEELLYQSNERYKSLFQDNHSVMLLIHPETGNIVDANPTACSYYGWSHQEICQRNINEINTLSRAEIAVELHNAKEEQRNHFFFRHKLATNEIRDVEVYSGPIKFGNDTLLYSLVHDITERKQNEEALHQSEERYKSLFQNNHSVMLLLNPVTGEIIDANPSACSFYGWSHSELCHKNLSEIDTLPVEELHSKLQASREEKVNHLFVEHRLANGDIRDVEVYSGPIRFNETTLLYVIIHDITERKQAEAALRTSEQKLSEIYASMSEGLAVHEIIYDRSGKTTDYIITEVNPAYEKITGIKRDEIIGKRASEIYMSDKAPYLDIYSQVESTGNSTSFETYFQPMNKQFSISVFSPGKGRFVTVFRDVTLQKQAEEALRSSERRLDAVFNSVTETIMMLDTAGTILAANDTAAKRWGFTVEEMTGKNMFDLAPSELRKTRNEQIHELIETGSAIRFEEHQDGHVFDITFYPIKESSGSINQFVVFNRDITEQRRAQEALRSNEERYSLIYNSSRDSIFSFDLSGKITSANRSFCEEIKLEVQEILGKTFATLGLSEILASEQETLMRRVIETNNTVMSELGIPASDGSVRYYEIILNPMHDGIGNIVGIGGSARNINKRKEADRALKDSERRFRYLVKDIPVGIIQFGSDGKVIMCNPKAIELLGQNDEQIRKKYTADDDWTTIREDGTPYPKEERPIPKTFSTGQQQKGVIIGVYRETTSDYVWLLIDTVIVFKEDGSIRNVVGTFIDITGIKKAENALKESEFFFRESQQAAFIGSYKTDFKTGKWESSEVLDQIFGIDKSYTRSVEGWLDMAHPDDRNMMNHYLMEDVLMKGDQFNKEYRIVRKNDHAVRWVHGLGRVDFDSNNIVKSLVGTIQDITERKAKEEALRKLNKTLAALSKSSQMMSQSEDETDYLKQVCNIVVEDTDFAMVWIGYAEDNDLKTIRPVASAGFQDNYLESIKLSWGDNEFGRGPTGIAIRTGKVGMCNNMKTDPDFEPWREQALKRGYAASIVFPLKNGDKTFGAITIYSKEPDSFMDDEIKLLSKLAGDLAHGITTIRLRKAHKLTEEALIRSHGELEVQVRERTAELMELNESLKITEEKYRTVADFATNWEFWIAPGEEMIYCSPSCERITGYSATEFALNSKLIYDIIHPDDLSIYLEHREKEKTAYKCEHEIQYRIFKRDGSMRWIGHFCRPVYDETGVFKGTRGSNKDITARKKMEELLITSNQKYKLLSENITDGIFICKNGKFEYINNAICDIFGYTAKELVGMKLTQLVMTDYHEELENFLYATPDVNQSCVIEVECLRNDFTVVYVEVLLNYSAREKTVYGVAHDITEKKEFQKNMVKAIIQTEEKERAHFSKELHDGLGPLLSTIKLYLQWSERPNSKSSREEIVGKAGEILEEALATVKEISNKLSPHLLINYGLNSAIKSFVDKLKATATYNIIFESNSTRRVDGNVEASLYRAIIECINNTLKYAKASNILIQLNDTGTQIQLRYTDDGTGFDINETIGEHKGLGLFNLQNRLHTIGGKVELKSEPGKGVDYLFTVNI